MNEQWWFTYGVVGNILDQRHTALFRQIVRLRVQNPLLARRLPLKSINQ
jgi:hypothetical protein